MVLGYDQAGEEIEPRDGRWHGFAKPHHRALWGDDFDIVEPAPDEGGVELGSAACQGGAWPFQERIAQVARRDFVAVVEQRVIAQLKLKGERVAIAPGAHQV